MPTPQEWLEILAPHDRENEAHAMAMFAVLGQPSNFLDVGSGTGAMVNLARKLGIDAYGVDIIPRPESHFLQHDLRQKFWLKRRFQAVSCIEVAEHIPLANIGNLVASVARHVEVGGYLVWSAAHPGQSGDEHSTCLPAYQWRTLLHEAGLEYLEKETLKLSLVWAWLGTPLMWLSSNVMVFGRRPPDPSIESSEE